jgi:hypothetical protein
VSGKEGFMKRIITIAAIAVAALFVVACPMPQLGPAHTKDAAGGDAGATTGAAPGSISVVNDAERGVAVYINESGQRFDVAAEETPGGVLVKCVDVSDFTIVPSTGDGDSLPVKAMVVGTRDDGSPGVWQINSDDTITLPQPEQTDDNTARCIVGGEMQSLPEGLQMRFGWTFKGLLTSADAKVIVGYAEQKQGTTYNSVQLAPGTRVAVFWRVSTLPYTRICMVSSPRVIGILSKPPHPSWWPARALSNILVQLKQFLLGKYEAYIVTPESIAIENGVYKVKGSDDEGVTAIARIDRNTVASIIEVPDLTVGSITFSPNPVKEGGTLALSAVVSNLTEGPALQSSLEFYLSADQSLDTKVDMPLLQQPVTVPPIAAMSSSDPIAASATIPSGVAAGTYYVIAYVKANDLDAESVTANNTVPDPTALTVSGGDSTSFDLSLNVTAPASGTVVSLNDAWPIGVTVTRSGASVPATVTYQFTNKAGAVIPTLTKPLVFDSPVATVSVGSVATDTLPGKVGDVLSSAPGTTTVTITVKASNGSNTVTKEWPPVDLAVKYPHVIIDTYDPAQPAPYFDVDGYYSVGATYNTVATLFVDPVVVNNGGLDSTGAVTRPETPESDGKTYVSYAGFAYIDYANGLAPGDYLVQVTLPSTSASTDQQAYAIRVLDALDLNYGPWVFDKNNQPTTPSSDSSSSATPLSLNGKAAKLLQGPSSANWFKITLP